MVAIMISQPRLTPFVHRGIPSQPKRSGNIPIARYGNAFSPAQVQILSFYQRHSPRRSIFARGAAATTHRDELQG
jgi:hypothetical protein